MGWDGLNYAVPALFVTYLTIGIGGVFLVIAVVVALVDRVTNSPSWRMPSAFYLLAASVAIELAGILTLPHIPYALLDRPILGTTLITFVWSSFLIASFSFTLASAFTSQWFQPVGRVVRIGSVVLIIVFATGCVWYLA